MTPLPIANGTYESESLPISAQSCINWYPNIVGVPALSQETLFGTPGLLQLTTSGTINQSNRGIHEMGGIPYFVTNQTLYSVDQTIDAAGDETFSITDLGTILGTERVWMSDNGTQLIIVTNGAGWIYTTGGGLVTISDAGFVANGVPETVIFISSYFVVTTDDKKAIISAPNDGTSWNSLDFIAAESDPDALVASINFKNQLFLFGVQTTEVFQPIATAGVPFARVEGFLLSKGLSAPHSLIEANDTIMWIGAGENETPAIWALNESTASKVSTTAIDTLLNTFTSEEISDVFATSYAQKGAYFVNFYLPTTCLSFNTVTQRWNEINSEIPDTNDVLSTERSRVNGLVTAYNRIIVTDSIDGRIGSLNTGTYSEYGNEIKRTVVTQPFSSQGNALTCPTLELTMEAGVGNEDDTNPAVRMSRSKNGKTFGDERIRYIGKVGEYERRTQWRRTGRVGRFELFKFEFSSKVKPVIIKLEGDIRGLSK